MDIESSPVVANGVVYIGDLSGQVYAIDEITGQKKGVSTTSGAIYSIPVVVTKQHKVFHPGISGDIQ